MQRVPLIAAERSSSAVVSLAAHDECSHSWIIIVTKERAAAGEKTADQWRHGLHRAKRVQPNFREQEEGRKTGERGPKQRRFCSRPWPPATYATCAA